MPRNRPFGIYVLVIFQLLLIAIPILESLIAGSNFSQIFDLNRLRQILNPTNLWLVTVPLALILIFGLWRMKRWAWFLIMTQIGSNLLIQLWQHFTGRNPSYISMSIYVIMVLYLNQREVRLAFQERVVEAEAQSLREELRS
ncbi:hypothetical protein MASR2M15_27620 [Anaerolineales bacterium]